MSELFDKCLRLLTSAVRTLPQAFYDDYTKVNAELRSNAGLKIKIIRESTGQCCDWCSDLEGTFEYGDAPDDIYARHRDCGCVVTVKTEKGYTDVWSKKTYETQKAARIAKEEEINRNATEAARKISEIGEGINLDTI